MRADLYWIPTPWPGKLAIGPRPRGGDWLPDEIASWRRAHIDTVMSLLTEAENQALDLTHEPAEVTRQRLLFRSLPIEDRQTPTSVDAAAAAIDELAKHLASGKNVLIHCRQGIGRAGLIAATLLVAAGQAPGEAITAVSTARDIPIPETPEQHQWIYRYSAILAS